MLHLLHLRGDFLKLSHFVVASIEKVPRAVVDKL